MNDYGYGCLFCGYVSVSVSENVNVYGCFFFCVNVVKLYEELNEEMYFLRGFLK